MEKQQVRTKTQHGKYDFVKLPLQNNLRMEHLPLLSIHHPKQLVV